MYIRDDTIIIYQGRHPVIVHVRVQIYLLIIQFWFKKWKIATNTEKSQAIVFKKGHFRNKLEKFRIFNKRINWCNQVKYLGDLNDKSSPTINTFCQSQKSPESKIQILA
ncbi:hypothetical protein NPIL_437601 [Nephila pilipes]|uniref:Uncharacterized protein n=1 Tax=Nephila pilipes TaxID=299642 RepID=A0A8X6PUG3_NEPPI|nr:hypothetical protein NPIL_437601 [Nephila pilipes]